MPRRGQPSSLAYNNSKSCRAFTSDSDNQSPAGERLAKSRSGTLGSSRLRPGLPGIKIKTGPTDYYPIQRLRLEKFDGKGFAMFGETISAE